MSELRLYLVAAVGYIALDVALPDLLYSWVEGTAFLLLVVWILPSLVLEPYAIQRHRRCCSRSRPRRRDRRLGARWTHRPADRRRRLLQQARACLGRRMGGLRPAFVADPHEGLLPRDDRAGRSDLGLDGPLAAGDGAAGPLPGELLIRGDALDGLADLGPCRQRLPVRPELGRSRLGRRRLRLRQLLRKH